mgnify:FL=1
MFHKFFLLGLVSITLLLFSYIQNFHESINFGSSITNLSVNSELVYSEKEKINLDISRSQSLDYIMESGRVQNMIPASDVKFISVTNRLALK